MGQSKTSNRRIEAAKKRALAVALRLAGYRIREIAEQVGLSPGQVSKTIKAAMEQTEALTAEAVREYRALWNARNEELVKGVWPKAKAGNLGAVDRVLKIQERAAKLNGLDGPVKIAPTDPSGDKTWTPPANEQERAERIAAILQRARMEGDTEAGD